MRKLSYLFVAFFILPIFSNAQQQFTLEDFVKNRTFSPESVRGLRSMNDGVYYTTNNYAASKIEKFSYKTGKLSSTVVNYSILGMGHVSDYEFSADEKKILFITNRKAIYRHSFYADYYIYDLKTKKAEKLTPGGAEQLATFSPDAQKIAFIRANNIFIKNLNSGDIEQITSDGKINEIINGAPDWVYEEEFGYNKAFAWAADGQKLAYCKFDETKVTEFGMDLYAGKAPHKEEYKTYPGREVWKYPKAGEDNSIVSVHIYQLKSKSTIKADVGEETDQYIPRIKWTKNANQLVIYRLNRLQNHLEFLNTNATTGQASLMFTDKNEYYIDGGDFDKVDFLENGFITLSERDGWAHLYHFDMSGKEINKLTSGDFDVTDYIGYDKNTQTVFYQAAAVVPMEREVYSVKLDGSATKKLSTKKGTNKAVFSTSYKYFINYFSNVSTPTQVSLHKSSGKQVRLLEDNASLQKIVSNYTVAEKQFIKIKTSEGIELNAWMLKPVDFDPAKKYPVFMTQYSGPNSQQVLNRWSMGWEYLLAQDGFITVCVDPRGTGARGEAFRKITYLQLGKYESDDMVDAAKYLASQDYVDENKIGIWGWSYGGFMTLLAMEKGDGIFRAGISVAPVTNWRYYDNIYTERFMRTPQENASGYDKNSPINSVEKLQGKLFLIHGMADDNVHFQNSVEFIAAAIEANIDIRIMIYPNRNHGIYGGNTRWYLYSQKYKFLLQELK